MAVRDIVLYPDEPLTEAALPMDADAIGPDTASLVADMFETMDSYDGSGLAAPQVGVPVRLCVLRDPDNGEELCLINPEISEREGSVTAEEGCLSLPYLYAMVPRAVRIRIRARNLDGEPIDRVVEGWLARIIQHETDHLDGIVFPDRLDILSREDKLREWQEIRATIRAAAGKI